MCRCEFTFELYQNIDHAGGRVGTFTSLKLKVAEAEIVSLDFS